MNFGNNLKVFRKNANISQEILAEKLGVSRQSVSKWENGETYPEMSNIVALCKIFHCQITDLINENMIDIEKFDENTKEGIIKFKKNQQRNLKRLSKAVYIIANICKIIISIPTVILFILAIVFPFISSNFSINNSYISIYNTKIDFSVKDNLLTIGDEKKYIDSKTDLAEFLSKHDNKYYIICIEYILICMAILSLLSVLILHFIYMLYKNMHQDDTPFSLKNEKIINKAIITYVIQFVLLKLTSVLFSLITKVDLGIEFNIKDLISILIILSTIYLFKYGRMIQVDTNAKIYDND